MISNQDRGLLTSRDAQPVRITNRDGRSMFLFVGDHAGNLVPERLDGLGLEAGDLDRHIACDLGVSVLGRRLSEMLDAPFVEQPYSRLVIDCNRAIDAEDSIVEVSDGIRIPGNARLTLGQRQQRIEAIFQPYHYAIASILGERDFHHETTILVSLHSFTPIFHLTARPWEIGVLHGGGEVRFAQSMLVALRGFSGLTVGDNEPYRLDQTDFTVPTHAISMGRTYVELEIRQDEISLDANLTRMAELLSKSLSRAADL